MSDQKNNRVRRRSGYSTIPNAAISDQRLSIEARGLLALLMSFHERWVFRSSHLMEVCGVGRDKYYRMTGELKTFGYLSHIVTKNEDGTFLGTIWEINDTPDLINRTTENTESGKDAPIRETNKLSENNGKPPLSPNGELTLFSDNQICPSKPKPSAMSSTEIDKHFEDFWLVYPHRNGRKEKKDMARKSFHRAIKGGATVQMIADGVRALQRDPQVASGYGRGPVPWLNQRGWTDEIPDTNGEQHGTGPHTSHSKGSSSDGGNIHQRQADAFLDAAVRREGGG